MKGKLVSRVRDRTGKGRRPSRGTLRHRFRLLPVELWGISLTAGNELGFLVIEGAPLGT